MAVIETKYGIGDKVWFANLTTQTFEHPCPDCLGSKTWVAESPAGAKFEVPCPRCSTSYQANHKLSLRYSKFVPSVSQLTIGSIRANTEIGAHDSGNSYMCNETGVGSGQVYREDNLFETREQATLSAQAQADIKNADQTGWVAQQYDETATFCDYELRDALIAAATTAASLMAYKHGGFMRSLSECETMADVRELIAEDDKDAA